MRNFCLSIFDYNIDSLSRFENDFSQFRDRYKVSEQSYHFSVFILITCLIWVWIFLKLSLRQSSIDTWRIFALTEKWNCRNKCTPEFDIRVVSSVHVLTHRSECRESLRNEETFTRISNSNADYLTNAVSWSSREGNVIIWMSTVALNTNIFTCQTWSLTFSGRNRSGSNISGLG